MCKRVGIATVILSICGILLIAILCTKLNTEQQLLLAAKYNAEAAKNRYCASKVEFINELYRFERYKILFKDAKEKDNWQQEVEELKIANGYYD